MGGSQVQTELLLGVALLAGRRRYPVPGAARRAAGAILGEGSAGPLVAREGDALSGALQLAEAEALSMPQVMGAGEPSPASPEPLSEEETERALSHSHGLNEEP